MAKKRAEWPFRPHFERWADKAIYSSIVVLAAIIALEDEPVGAWQAYAYVVSVGIAIGLAELFADYIGTTINQRRHLTRPELRAAIRNDASATAVAMLPTLFLLLAALGVFGVQTGLDLAEWTGIGVLGSYAFFANRIAGFSVLRSLLAGAAFTLLGVVLVLIKAFTAH